MRRELVVVEGLKKSFSEGDEKVCVLRGLNLTVFEGEFVGVFGPSGSGKTTLLHIMLGIELPDEGKVIVDGVDMFSGNEDEILKARRAVSIVFQRAHLFDDLTSLENVMLPLLLRGVSKEKAEYVSMKVLGDLGLLDRRDHLPSELSGGERQRVAIARAVVTEPKLILADEPTGNLDEEREKSVMELFWNMKKERAFSLIMVTHNRSLLSGFDKIYQLKEGVLKDPQVC